MDQRICGAGDVWRRLDSRQRFSLYEREIADPFLKFGRYIFAMAFVAFGIQHFFDPRLTIRVGPPWFPGRPIWMYLTGIFFVLAGSAIFLEKKARIAAKLLGRDSSVLPPAAHPSHRSRTA